VTTHAKEDFWIGAKGGLVEWKHYKRMGKAVWLFLHLLRCQTAVSQHGEGVVYYGHPITLESIRRETKGFPVRTLKEWAIRLRRQGYIRTEDHGCKGLVFWVLNAKDKTKKATVRHINAPVGRKAIHGFGQITVPIGTGVRQFSVPIAARAGQESVPIETKPCPQANRIPTVAAESISPTPKVFIPKNLSNYNTAAAAQSAASYPSLSAKNKVKAIQQPPTPKPKPSNPEFIAWQNRQAERDPAIAAFRKKCGL
jgi:hypothetical protein